MISNTHKQQNTDEEQRSIMKDGGKILPIIQIQLQILKSKVNNFELDDSNIYWYGQ